MTQYCASQWGGLVSYYSTTIKKIVNYFRKQICWETTIICLITFVFRTNVIMHELLSVFFCLNIILLCIHIKIENPLLLFLGRYAFEIYILQRIPMMLLQKHIVGYSYIVICFVTSVMLAVLFKVLERKVDLLLKI